MTSSKLSAIFLPLLFSVFLFIASNLRIGRIIDNVSYSILYPIRNPMSILRVYTNDQIGFIKNIPTVFKENQYLKEQNSLLTSENQSLKNLIQDQSLLNNLQSSYKKVLPVRVISVGNNITATTTLDLSEVSPGMPVKSGSSLVGIVKSVNKPVITITPLSDESFPSIQLISSLGQSGSYQYSARTAQIINIPSETPVSLNDQIFTQASEKIPANLIVGKITNILTSSQSPLQKAEIKLELDPARQKELEIIIAP